VVIQIIRSNYYHHQEHLKDPLLRPQTEIKWQTQYM